MNMKAKNTFSVEVTDTMGGEANYSWVRRYTLEADEGTSDLALVRRAKKLAGWEGVRCNTANFGDTIELRPQGMCCVMFITYQEPRAAAEYAEHCPSEEQ